MTQPESSVSAENLGIAVQELVAQAKKLGLIWELKPATIVRGSVPNNIIAVYDGDTTPLSMSSLIGIVADGKHVQVISIPPAGHFIIGEASTAMPMLYGQAGTARVSFTGTSTTHVVQFEHPFDSAPSVVANINSAAGQTANFHSRVYNILTTEFTIFIFGSGASVTWTNIPVVWMAMRQTQ